MNLKDRLFVIINFFYFAFGFILFMFASMGMFGFMGSPSHKDQIISMVIVYLYLCLYPIIRFFTRIKIMLRWLGIIIVIIGAIYLFVLPKPFD